MTKLIKIIVIGPFPNPISGVSIANKNVKNILDQDSRFNPSFINTTFPEFEEGLGKFSFKKFFFFCRINLKIYKIFTTNKVYITPGQTFLGIVKYAPFILLSWMLKKELIIHVHGNYLRQQYNLLNGFKKYVFSFLISRFQKGIVLSDSLRSNLLPFLNDSKIFSLPNFAEDYLYQSSFKKDINEIRVIYLSNLMIEKGIIELLNVLKVFEENGIKYKARIAGNIDKESKEDINKLLSSLNSTEYLGVVKGNDKKELLLWGNIFVLPTYYKMEGQPISIIEALATKNIIITTEHAGIPDIIKSGVNGFFVKKQSVNDLSNKIISIIDSNEFPIDIMKNNEKLFLSRFTLNKFRESLLEIFIR